MDEAAASRPYSSERVPRSLRQLAWFMDDSIRLPGGYRVGMDGLVGLIPGVGDAVGAMASGYILLHAWRLGIPNATLGRMGANVLIEMLVGAIPLIGDLFDFAWKANRRNLRLIESHLDEPLRARRRDTWVLLALVVGVLVFAGLVVWLIVQLLEALWVLATG